MCQNFYSTFVYGPILIKIGKNAIIMKTQFFMKLYMTWNITLRHSDLITTLTYVLMDNFSPCVCFICILCSQLYKIENTTLTRATTCQMSNLFLLNWQKILKYLKNLGHTYLLFFFCIIIETKSCFYVHMKSYNLIILLTQSVG